MVRTLDLFNNPLAQLAAGERTLFFYQNPSDWWPPILSRVLWLHPRSYNPQNGLIFCDAILLGLDGGRSPHDFSNGLLYCPELRLSGGFDREPSGDGEEPIYQTHEDGEFVAELSDEIRKRLDELHGPEMAERLLTEDWLRQYPAAYIHDHLRRSPRWTERLSHPFRRSSPLPRRIISLGELGDGAPKAKYVRSPVFPE